MSWGTRRPPRPDWIEWARGMVRLFRGRCPACAGKVPDRVWCFVCQRYDGPWPASPETRRAWADRWLG